MTEPSPEPTIFDTTVLPTMEALLLCLAGELERSTVGGVGTVFLASGEQAVADYCGALSRGGCQSQAWVRLVRAYPSRAFPSADVEPVGGCPTAWAITLELGVLRCRAVAAEGRGGQKGAPPSAATVTQQTADQMADFGSMRRAVSCCDSLTPRTTLFGEYQPLDSGDCGGGTLLVTTAIRRRS